MFQHSPFHSEGMLQSVSWQHYSGSCSFYYKYYKELALWLLLIIWFSCSLFSAVIIVLNVHECSEWFPRIMYSVNPSLEITRIWNSEEIIEENKFKKLNYVSYLYSQVWRSLIFIAVKISSLTSEISLLKINNITTTFVVVVFILLKQLVKKPSKNWAFSKGGNFLLTKISSLKMKMSKQRWKYPKAYL